MSLIGYIFCLIFLIILCMNTYTSGDVSSNLIQVQQYWPYNNYYTQQLPNVFDKVHIQLFYESFCPACRRFDTTKFKEVVLLLNQYLNIQTYPYGNAQTFERNGKYTFKCQHGPGECYGNKLHACALNIIRNQTQALLFNSCMMDLSQSDRGSDDNAADMCAMNMGIDSGPIKACAKSERGSQLLKYYGDKSKRANFHYVPYILVNGKESDGRNFMRVVCAAYTNPPPPCAMVV